MLAPIKRSRIYERIVEQIQQLVAQGHLQPGGRLPTERELAAIFGVSRTSVREALRALELRGIIEGRQGGGTFIKQVSPEQVTQSLVAAFLAGKKELADILELRQLIEPGVAQLAAERASSEHLAYLEELLERQRQRIAAGDSYVDEDTRFHYTLAVATGNSALLRLMDAIMDMLKESRAIYLQVGDRPVKSLAGHALILEAVKRHDGPAAYKATAEHVRAVREALLGED